MYRHCNGFCCVSMKMETIEVCTSHQIYEVNEGVHQEPQSGKAHLPLIGEKTNRCSMHTYASYSHSPYNLLHIPLHIRIRFHSTYCVPIHITT